MIDEDTCGLLHEDYCTLDGDCSHQVPVVQNGEVQTFPGCNATSEELWRIEE